MFQRYKPAFLIPVVGLLFWAWSTVRAEPVPPSVASGSIFRCNNTRPVYYKGSDGKRYLFQDDVTFKTWYPNYNRVINISQSSCNAISLGGNVTVRPGSVLLQIEGSKTLYAVSAPNVLRWVSTTETARVLYPSSIKKRPDVGWQSKVRILNKTFLANYVLGEALKGSSKNPPAFKPVQETARATSVNRVLPSSQVVVTSSRSTLSRVNSSSGNTGQPPRTAVVRSGGGGGSSSNRVSNGGGGGGVGGSQPVNPIATQTNSTGNTGNVGNVNTGTNAQTQGLNNAQGAQSNAQVSVTNNANQGNLNNSGNSGNVNTQTQNSNSNTNNSGNLGNTGNINTGTNTQSQTSNNAQGAQSQNNSQGNTAGNTGNVGNLNTASFVAGVSDIARVIAKPVLALQAVGQWFNDPVFGTRIKRVTDRVRLSNDGFGTPIYSQLQAFSLGSGTTPDSQFILLIEDGDYVVRRVGNGQQATINLPDVNAPRWLPGRANTIVAYDTNADTVLRVLYSPVGSSAAPETHFTFPTNYFRIRGNQSNDELSHDGRWMTGMAAMSSGSDTMFALDLQNRRLGAQVSLGSLYTGVGAPCERTGDANESSDPVDWIAASPSGRTMAVQFKRDGTGRCSGLETFDMQTGAYVGRAYDGHQHGDLGIDAQGDFFMTFETVDTPFGDPYVSVRRLPGPANGVSAPNLVTRLRWSQSGWHISCQSSAPFCSVVLGGDASEPGGGDPTGPMSGEIILQYSDGRVLRVAHHRSTSAGYWVQPRATVSRDARYIAFASDWGVNRTAASNDNLGRGEAYIMELPANVANGPTTTTVTTTTPSPQGQTNSGNTGNTGNTNTQTQNSNTNTNNSGNSGNSGDSNANVTGAGMSFFVTSRGMGNGGNFDGLSGADAFCKQLADVSPQVAARGKIWRAYLSAASPLTQARIRVGAGPWTNFSGRAITASTFLTGIPYNDLLDERGMTVQRSNEHDIVTGSDSSGNLAIVDGNPHTCGDWTMGTDDSATTVGHADWNIRGEESATSQHTVSCSQRSFNQSAGVGRLYCFAVNASSQTNSGDATTNSGNNNTNAGNSGDTGNSNANSGNPENVGNSNANSGNSGGALPSSTYMTGSDSVDLGLADAEWFSPVRGSDFVKVAFSHDMGAPLSECSAASDFMKYDLYFATGSSTNYAHIASHLGQLGGADFTSSNGSIKESSGECTKGTFVYKVMMPASTNNVAICISNANDPSQRYCRAMQVSTAP